MAAIPSETVSTDTAYQVDLVQSVEAFEALSGEWQALLKACHETSLFLDHAWLLTWIRHFPPDHLLVITVRDTSGALIAAAPLKINRGRRGAFNRLLRHVQFIGTDPTVYDWMRILCLTQADTEAILAEMARQLLRVGHLWDTIDLRFLNDRSQLECLAQHLGPRCFRQKVFESSRIPYLRLPGMVMAYEDQLLRRSFKRDLKRVRNHLQRDFPGQELCVEFQTPSEATDQQLDAFFTHHAEYWGQRGFRTELARYPGLASFYKAVFRKFQPEAETLGRMRFSLLKIRETIFSYDLGFWQGESYIGHMTSYYDAFKKYRPGVLHIDAMIRHTIEQGGRSFEFGRGDEPYKAQWVCSYTPLYSLTVYRTRLACWLAEAESRLKQLLLPQVTGSRG